MSQAEKVYAKYVETFGFSPKNANHLVAFSQTIGLKLAFVEARDWLTRTQTESNHSNLKKHGSVSNIGNVKEKKLNKVNWTSQSALNLICAVDGNDSEGLVESQQKKVEGVADPVSLGHYNLSKQYEITETTNMQIHARKKLLFSKSAFLYLKVMTMMIMIIMMTMRMILKMTMIK
ncbi:hypothetical protein RFI_07878 [Reticulomyxa filosa]|uniref:Uncharacterized protein n=1 Tax=Reticulomyxa filosa TaxID=46433 RepID=X6NTH0_RETFI|nr:hypothetical protein RFI_07878 [Reticulomyxa filosa]|eukprot:ETO29248.1 hypothetical protein RFI_07878 [Reticulomyxa filosa]